MQHRTDYPPRRVRLQGRRKEKQKQPLSVNNSTHVYRFQRKKYSLARNREETRRRVTRRRKLSIDEKLNPSVRPSVRSFIAPHEITAPNGRFVVAIEQRRPEPNESTLLSPMNREQTRDRRSILKRHGARRCARCFNNARPSCGWHGGLETTD